MVALRRGFYLLIGFTFPMFWAFHSAGYIMSHLYEPIQRIAGTASTGWPSFVSACLLYLTAIIFFEVSYRLLVKYHP